MGVSSVAMGLAPAVFGAVPFFGAVEPDAARLEAAPLMVACCLSCGASCATAVATSSMIPRTILNCAFIAILPLMRTLQSHTSAPPLAAVHPPPRCVFLDHCAWHLAPDPLMRYPTRQSSFPSDVNGTSGHQDGYPRQDRETIFLQGVRRLNRRR